MANNKVTIQDIANELGLSRNTVSKAMNNTGSISERTKNKIFQKATEMGYKQFALLSSAPDNTVPLKNTELREISLFTHSLLGSSHFGSKLIDSFQKKIENWGYRLSIYMIRNSELEQLTFPSNFNIEHSAGILCLELFHKEYSQFLCKSKIPIVFVDTVVNHCRLNLQADLLYMENQSSSYLMLQSIIEKGNSQISFVGDRYHCHSFYERWQAYCQLLSDYQLPVNQNLCILAPDSSNYHDSEWMSNKIKQLPVLPNAFFCANDSLGISVLKALKSMNYSVPEDIMVCGFDNAPESTVIEPTLTTVRIPSSSMGYTAAELLLSRIEHPKMPYRITYIKTDIIYRDSTRK